MRFQNLVRACANFALACSCALSLLSLVPSDAQAKPSRGKTTHRSTEGPVSSQEARIASIVEISQPRRGKGYARRVARAMVRSAKRWNVDPLLVAAIGYKESEFSMSSRPCVGVMQVHPPTYREMCKEEARKEREARKKGTALPHPRAIRDADIYDLEDNIDIGTAELAKYLRRYDGRKRSALGRYNGCGAGGGYVTLVLRIYGRFQDWSVDKMARHVKRGRMLWSAA